METRETRKLAIIPTWRDPNIANVISRFRTGVVDEICVVADEPAPMLIEQMRSAGKTARLPMHIIVNEERKGIGYAIRKGMSYALEKGYDVVVVMAGNQKDDPTEIARLLKPIVEEGYDYVQGSRFLPGGKHKNLPLFRGIFNRVWPFIWTLFTSKRCTDVTNGFRAYRTRILEDKRVDLNQQWLDGYALEYYLHYKALTTGYRTKEAPVSKIYSHRNRGGYSKISPLRDWWQIVGPFIYLALRVKK